MTLLLADVRKVQRKGSRFICDQSGLRMYAGRPSLPFITGNTLCIVVLSDGKALSTIPGLTRLTAQTETTDVDNAQQDRKKSMYPNTAWYIHGCSLADNGSRCAGRGYESHVKVLLRSSDCITLKSIYQAERTQLVHQNGFRFSAAP